MSNNNRDSLVHRQSLALERVRPSVLRWLFSLACTVPWWVLVDVVDPSVPFLQELLVATFCHGLGQATGWVVWRCAAALKGDSDGH